MEEFNDFSRLLYDFPVLFKAYLIFKDFQESPLNSSTFQAGSTNPETAMVMLGWSVHLTTLFPGQAWLSVWPVLSANTLACTWQQPFLNQWKEENDCRNHFMFNLHESMERGWNRTRDPWICRGPAHRPGLINVYTGSINEAQHWASLWWHSKN